VRSSSGTPLLAVARRYCDPRGDWRESDFTDCASFTESTIRNISNVGGAYLTG
jgi:hypothetical protein